eukprot:TRINITY_DN9336_c0_g1_i1.p3 TRINITY_DN9336_c0_g1~~TRINITY_DN9336_c0_g1_i1.p3  ORF type:complete len:108 (+),score=9.21 TRINITY_DN9336_c0_g1_i1:301-624(+)
MGTAACTDNAQQPLLQTASLRYVAPPCAAARGAVLFVGITAPHKPTSPWLMLIEYDCAQRRCMMPLLCDFTHYGPKSTPVMHQSSALPVHEPPGAQFAQPSTIATRA